MSTPGGGEPAKPPRPRTDVKTAVSRTRISGIWVSAIIATVLLVLLLIFILQNTRSVTVQFLGVSWGVPLGVAMLFSAIVGALLVALPGAARILQLRRRVHKLGTRR